MTTKLPTSGIQEVLSFSHKIILTGDGILIRQIKSDLFWFWQPWFWLSPLQGLAKMEARWKISHRSASESAARRVLKKKSARPGRLTLAARFSLTHRVSSRARPGLFTRLPENHIFFQNSQKSGIIWDSSLSFCISRNFLLHLSFLENWQRVT